MPKSTRTTKPKKMRIKRRTTWPETGQHVGRDPVIVYDVLHVTNSLEPVVGYYISAEEAARYCADPAWTVDVTTE